MTVTSRLSLSTRRTYTHQRSPLVVWLIAKALVASVAHQNSDVRRSDGSCVINLVEQIPGFAVNEMYGGRALSSPVTVAQAVDSQAWGSAAHGATQNLMAIYSTSYSEISVVAQTAPPLSQ